MNALLSILLLSALPEYPSVRAELYQFRLDGSQGVMVAVVFENHPEDPYRFGHAMLDVVMDEHIRMEWHPVHTFGWLINGPEPRNASWPPLLENYNARYVSIHDMEPGDKRLVVFLLKARYASAIERRDDVIRQINRNPRAFMLRAHNYAEDE